MEEISGSEIFEEKKRLDLNKKLSKNECDGNMKKLKKSLNNLKYKKN